MPLTAVSDIAGGGYPIVKDSNCMNNDKISLRTEAVEGKRFKKIDREVVLVLQDAFFEIM